MNLPIMLRYPLPQLFIGSPTLLEAYLTACLTVVGDSVVVVSLLTGDVMRFDYKKI